MREIKVLAQSSLKLIFRNKAFWFFLLALPVISLVIIIAGENENGSIETESGQSITELKDISVKTAYSSKSEGTDMRYVIKVYDSSVSALSEYLLNQLVESGMIDVCRADTTKLPDKEIRKSIKEDAFCDRMGASLYLKGNFDSCLLQGSVADGICLYQCAEDERFALAEKLVNDVLTRMVVGAGTVSEEASGEEVCDILEKQLPMGKEVTNIEKDDFSSLSGKQKSQKSRLGWSVAMTAMGFLCCGIFISYTVMEEESNHIYTRIRLTGTDEVHYILSKLVVMIVLSLIEIAVYGLGLYAFIDFDFGISGADYLGLVFMNGTIFGMIGLVLGIFMNSAMAVNYTAFCIWSFSSMLSGVYFPINATNETLKKISQLMPQRWFLELVEKNMSGAIKNIYPNAIVIMVSFLVVILGLGAVGLRIKRTEN